MDSPPFQKQPFNLGVFQRHEGVVSFTHRRRFDEIINVNWDSPTIVFLFNGDGGDKIGTISIEDGELADEAPVGVSSDATRGMTLWTTQLDFGTDLDGRHSFGQAVAVRLKSFTKTTKITATALGGPYRGGVLLQLATWPGTPGPVLDRFTNWFGGLGAFDPSLGQLRWNGNRFDGLFNADGSPLGPFTNDTTGGIAPDSAQIVGMYFLSADGTPPFTQNLDADFEAHDVSWTAFNVYAFPTVEAASVWNTELDFSRTALERFLADPQISGKYLVAALDDAGLPSNRDDDSLLPAGSYGDRPFAPVDVLGLNTVGATNSDGDPAGGGAFISTTVVRTNFQRDVFAFATYWPPLLTKPPPGTVIFITGDGNVSEFYDAHEAVWDEANWYTAGRWWLSFDDPYFNPFYFPPPT